MITPMQYCFNCGKPFASSFDYRKTKDHIPPQCFYVGFPESYKVNRKTVPSCFKCNNSFSKIDKLFRNVLGFTNDIDGNERITTEAVKSLFDKGQIQGSNPQNASITIRETDIVNFHKRCFKALHAKTYREYLDEKLFQIEVIHEHDYERISFAMILQQFVTKDNSWQISGHSDVFKYCIKQIAFDEKREMIIANSLPESFFIGIVMVYLECYSVVCIATGKNQLANL